MLLVLIESFGIDFIKKTNISFNKRLMILAEKSL